MNNNNFLTFINKCNERISFEEFSARMSIITPESRNLIELKWGLQEETVPMSYKQINEQLGINNSKELINTAIKEFKDSKYLIFFADRDEMSRRLAYNLGCLVEKASRITIRSPFKELKPDFVLGKKLLEAIMGLPERESRVLTISFGLTETDTEILTLQKTSEFFGVSPARIGQLQCNAFHMLAHPSRESTFMIEIIEKEKEKSHEKKPDVFMMKTEEFEMSIRATNCLIGAGVITGKDLFELSIDDILKIKNIGRRAAEEVIAKRKELFPFD